MKKAVLLLSSGLDSAANLRLGETVPSGFQVPAALTVDYGQRGAAREIASAKKLAEHFGVQHIVARLPEFSTLVAGKSALLRSVELPRLDAGHLDDLSATKESAKAVWVPNRNGFLINLAAAVAESQGFDAVAVGFNAEEAVTFPDNTVEFMAAATEGLRYSTSNGVQIVSATAPLNKKQIVEELEKLEFPFELIWSCYESGGDDTKAHHCGHCESCLRLHRALTTGLKSVVRRDDVLHRLFGRRPAVS